MTYSVSVELWEDDMADWTDDHWQTDTVTFGDSGRARVTRRDENWYDDTIYALTFEAQSVIASMSDVRSDADGKTCDPCD